jgi:hypothetical protein
MKKIALLFYVSISLIACQNKNQEDTVAVTKALEKEPTRPEETEIWEPKPTVVNVNELTGIPSDAVLLFDGTNFDEWTSSQDSTAVDWILNSDLSMTVKDKAGNIQTKRNFGDVQLHLEWRSSVEIRADGQNRSNSGVFLQKRYEVQILDNNNNNDTYVNGQVGSLYKQATPLVQASAKTGDWNAYDIIYKQPLFDANGKLLKKGILTVLHNGVLIQDHIQIVGTTEYIGKPKNKAHGRAPIMLQDHADNSGVSYRNIWLREL